MPAMAPVGETPLPAPEMAADERFGHLVRPPGLFKPLSLNRLIRRTYPLREEARRKGVKGDFIHDTA